MAACHTKANNKKKTGITGNTSTIGLKQHMLLVNEIIIKFP
jgi:hypothetical protein